MGIIDGKPSENGGFEWENHRKTIGKWVLMGKPWENHRKTIGIWEFLPSGELTKSNGTWP